VAAATRRAPLATPVACKSRQVHGQREGLAELAGVDAGFQDAHPLVQVRILGYCRMVC
jgi:hypothetical protein